MLILFFNYLGQKSTNSWLVHWQKIKMDILSAYFIKWVQSKQCGSTCLSYSQFHYLTLWTKLADGSQPLTKEQKSLSRCRVAAFVSAALIARTSEMVLIKESQVRGQNCLIVTFSYQQWLAKFLMQLLCISFIGDDGREVLTKESS